MKDGEWLPVAKGAADARDVLRASVLPAAVELTRIAPEGAARELALKIQDGVFAAVGKLVLGLKGRGGDDGR